MKNEKNVEIKSSELLKIIVKNCPQAILIDGFDECIVGVHIGVAQTNVLYSFGKIIHTLMKRDEMDYNEACEFFDYNIAGLCFPNDITPYYLKDSYMNPSLN